MIGGIVKFTVALAIGAGVGYLVTKNYYEKIIDEEIESVKEHFGRRRPELKEDGDRDDSVTVQGGDGKVINILNNPVTRSSLDHNPYEQAKRNYNLVRPEPPVEKKDKPEEEVTDPAGMTEQGSINRTVADTDEPYIIDCDAFSTECDRFDKVSLYYYVVDDVLTEEGEEVVDDIEGTVGYEALKALDMQTTVWVRNERLSIDYEIVAIKKSYAEAVHGVGGAINMSPRERYLAKQKGREKNEE